jgi:hypothetical protein
VKAGADILQMGLVIGWPNDLWDNFYGDAWIIYNAAYAAGVLVACLLTARISIGTIISVAASLKGTVTAPAFASEKPEF